MSSSTIDKLLERIDTVSQQAGFTSNELYLIIKLCICELKLHAVLSEVSDVTANVDAVNSIITGAFSHDAGLVKVIVGNVLGDLDVPVMPSACNVPRCKADTTQTNEVDYKVSYRGVYWC